MIMWNLPAAFDHAFRNKTGEYQSPPSIKADKVATIILVQPQPVIISLFLRVINS